MISRNVFAVARSIWDDSDFAPEPFTEREAWMWLVSAAAWKDIRARGNSGAIDLKRGEFSFATRFLAEKWDWSKSRVDRFIQRVEKRDMIRDTSRDGSKVYSINKYNHFQVVGIPKRDGARDTSRDDDGTAAGQQRDKEETGKQVNRKEVSKTPAKADVAVPKPVLPDWIDKAAWAGFVEMRKRIRAPMTGRAEKLAIAELERLANQGHDPTAVLDQSTRNSWKGLFPIKAENQNGKRQSAHDNFNAGTVLYLEQLARESRGQGEDSDAADGTRRRLLSP